MSEWVNRSFLRESLIRCFAHKKQAICSKNLTKIIFLGHFLDVFFQMSHSFIPSFLMSESLRLITKYERCERIAQVAHQKWANERIARFFEQIAHSLMIRSFIEKTSDFLRKPMREFPTMQNCRCTTVHIHHAVSFHSPCIHPTGKQGHWITSYY